MHSGDFSFSLNMSANQAQPARRCIARPFEAHPVGDEALILAAGDEASVRAPLFYARMLGQLGQFRTVDAHTDAVVQAFGLPAEQRGAVRQALAGLIERDLLRDEQQVLDRLEAVDKPAPGDDQPIRTLCIRTCDRPRELEQLLTSLRRRCFQSGLERVLVLDDAQDGQAAMRSARVLEQADLPAGIDRFHIDRAARARLTRRMAEAAGSDPEQLAWLIEGDRGDKQPSYGANLNLAVLLTAGERFAMIDDDARLDPFVLEPPGPGLSLRSEHDFRVHFPDPDRSETEQFQALDRDPLAEHAALLGQSVARIASRHGLQDGRLLGGLSPQMIHEFSARPRVRLTTNGTLGDAGTGSMLWQYALPPQELAPWLSGPEQYRRLAFGRRVARSTTETQIASSVSLMTTTLTGIDNRELLLPVTARGRGEDLMFGATIRFLYPGTPCAALPWMLPHRIETRRRWRREDLARARSTGLAAYLSDRIERFAETRLPDDPVARSGVLAEWLKGLGQTGEDKLVIDLRRHLLERRAGAAARTSRTLAGLNPPDWLKTDFTALIDRNRAIGPEDSAGLSRLAPAVCAFAAAYGTALDSWVQTWQWAAGQDPQQLLGESI
ncbi:MAG: hypothetical protein EA419_03975 [Wenzhouxiangella sp.]|nr:MAG: hypothetical protein EA419_03975 [Wenzhouxiangella sp.]